jgi:hypothetical protein
VGKGRGSVEFFVADFERGNRAWRPLTMSKLDHTPEVQTKQNWFASRCLCMNKEVEGQEQSHLSEGTVFHIRFVFEDSVGSKLANIPTCMRYIGQSSCFR